MRQERHRLQIACFLNIFLLSGSRPGSIIVSTSHRGSNTTILYGDCYLALTPYTDGRMCFQLKIKLRHMKSKRGKVVAKVYVAI